MQAPAMVRSAFAWSVDAPARESDIFRPALFLDKDGTVLDDVPYNTDPARMHLAPGAAEALRLFGSLGLPLFVISNQAGVAMGRFGIEALDGVDVALREIFLAHGATLTAFYFCPHHPQGGASVHARPCMCRKPNPGLLLRASCEHRIDLANSWFIGDILDDVEAGRRAGCRTILIDNGNETEWQASVWREPEFMVKDLHQAALLVAGHQGAAPGVGDAGPCYPAPCGGTLHGAGEPGLPASDR